MGYALLIKRGVNPLKREWYLCWRLHSFYNLFLLLFCLLTKMFLLSSLTPLVEQKTCLIIIIITITINITTQSSCICVQNILKWSHNRLSIISLVLCAYVLYTCYVSMFKKTHMVISLKPEKNIRRSIYVV